jgi:hypothetical protein
VTPTPILLTVIYYSGYNTPTSHKLYHVGENQDVYTVIGTYSMTSRYLFIGVRSMNKGSKILRFNRNYKWLYEKVIPPEFSTNAIQFS